ncbi:hypothetical protein M413DRAFT_442291 [Hebeloma cylindrosporum]|uniref:Uncharacterized protein n=1 Tax=Hebeloma cylindrosporum TaxID=76867 RepID=A0A0C3CNJ8_HEBCY|nr:hypothetical protein M413DRAFT_442291 [Hebeloma cylindrosporum h7]
MTTPAKGNEDERRVWKQWARTNGLTNANGRFITNSISGRRIRFRTGLANKDIHLLNAIEKNLIDLVHFRNSVVERWPESIRTMLNDGEKNGQGSVPFDSWHGPPGLERRKQAARVLTDLIQFFVREYHINNVTWLDNDTALAMRATSGYFPEMGFTISEDSALGDDILDIDQGSNFGIEHMKNPIHQLCLNIIMQANPTAKTNPLLFWVGLILQTEEFGHHQRLEFSGLKDTLTTREKLEALVHYARVFIMDFAYTSWLGSDSVHKEWKTAVESALNSKPSHWVDQGLPRPVDQRGDPTDFSQPHWKSFKTHFEPLRTQWLVKGSNSPIGVILELL